MQNLTALDLSDLALVTGGQAATAAPMLGGVTPSSGMVNTGVANMGWGGTKQFGGAGGFNAPGVGSNGPLSGVTGGGGGGGGKLNPFESGRDQLLY